MPIVDDPNEGRFSQMLALLRHSAEFLRWVIEIVRSMPIEDQRLAHALSVMPGVVEDRSRDLINAVLSHEYDDALADHGLDNESFDWQFKLAGYQAALERVDELNIAAGDSRRRKRKGLKKVQTVLKWLNVPLRSIAGAIPGAGGAYNEVKDGVEATVDTAVDQPGAFKKAAGSVARVVGRLNPLRRAEPSLPTQPPEETPPPEPVR